MANDAHISGSGRISGGEYYEIHISGTGRWEGPTYCKSFHVSGSCSGTGPLTVMEELHCSGSLRADSYVDCGEVHISGSARVEGNVAGHKEVHISGSLKCRSLYGGVVSISGGLDTQGDVEADSFQMSGGGEIRGLLNAEEIDIKIDGFPRTLKIGNIGGSKILIEPARVMSLLNKLFNGNSAAKGSVSVDEIEGDEIDLASTTANVVRGSNIILRDGCRIGRVEYSGTLDLEGDAQVGETIKI